MEHAELDTFTNRQPCYVYRIPPAGSSAGHRADAWNVDSWLEEVRCKVVECGDACTVRLLTLAGELFGECPVPNDAPLPTAVERVVDSSRYFVVRLLDRASGRHAFLGLGFRERADASGFEEALFDHAQQLRRGREAAALREQFHTEATEVSAAAGAVRKLGLKPGETLTLKAVKPAPKAGTGPGSWLSSAISASSAPSARDAPGESGAGPGSLLLPPPPEQPPSQPREEEGQSREQLQPSEGRPQPDRQDRQGPAVGSKQEQEDEEGWSGFVS